MTHLWSTTSLGGRWGKVSYVKYVYPSNKKFFGICPNLVVLCSEYEKPQKPLSYLVLFEEKTIFAKKSYNKNCSQLKKKRFSKNFPGISGSGFLIRTLHFPDFLVFSSFLKLNDISLVCSQIDFAYISHLNYRRGLLHKHRTVHSHKIIEP